MRRLILAFAACVAFAAPALAQEAPAQSWSFNGIFGTYDRAALQRGFQVYREVCATCHSLRLVAYRNLADLGYSAEEVRAIAASAEMPTLNDSGEAATRAGTPADHFRSPFANDLAARAANNGALPPDLSVIVKARDGGANYIYALMTGYGDAPAGMQMMEGMSYNHVFPGNQIAMPLPLQDDRVQYADSTRATVAQMARDVTAFLAWTAEPELEARHKLGVQAILFLLVLTGLLYAVKRKVWSALH
jgi:ubiquinol-cytochrome c reductase cytochrome c1 subunit